MGHSPRLMFRRIPHVALITVALSGATLALADSPTQVFEKASPSIVVVEATDSKGNGALGSGVALGPGELVTNCHVVRDATAIRVHYGATEYQATVHYGDWDRDMCQLSAPGLRASIAALGATKNLKVGARVYAIGAPQGLELSLFEGIVSSLRSVPGGTLIQTTTAISPGSSGGGLFDDNGRLIGITTFYLANGQNLNFAIPVEWITQLSARHRAVVSSAPTEGWVLKATELRRKKEWQALLLHAKAWVKAQAKDSDAWYYLAVAYEGLGQPGKTIEAYQEALRLEPEDADIWCLLGLAYDDLGQFEKAMAAYREALRIKPDHEAAWFSLGGTYRNLKQLDKAIGAYRQGLRIKPEDAGGWAELGATYSELGQLDNAVEAYQKSLRIKPEDAGGWFGLGATYHDLGQLEKAIEAYQEALRIKPEYTAAWAGLGRTYSGLGQLEKAIEAFHEALRIKPGYAAAWFGLGYAHKKLGQLDKAIEAYQQGLRITPKDALGWSGLGAAYYHRKQLDKAIAAYQEALRLEPENADTWYMVGVAYYASGNRTKVMEVYNRLKALDPRAADEFFHGTVLP